LLFVCSVLVGFPAPEGPRIFSFAGRPDRTSLLSCV
jgi:hypothetical protein